MPALAFIGLLRGAGAGSDKSDLARDRFRLAQIFGEAILADHRAHGGVCKILRVCAVSQHADPAGAAHFRQQRRPGAEIFPIAAAKVRWADSHQVDFAIGARARHKARRKPRFACKAGSVDGAGDVLARCCANRRTDAFGQRCIAHGDDQRIIRRCSLNKGDAALRHRAG